MAILTGSIQIAYKTAAAWTSANTVLLSGQEGHESDTGKRKIGDGTTAWNSLAYLFTATGAVTSVSGTTNRVTSTGGATPVIDISDSYVGQASITTLGTISSGAVPSSIVTAGTFGTGAYVMNTSLTTPLVIGSAASAGNLTLSSTSHATKGKILLGQGTGTNAAMYDEVNYSITLGTSTPISSGADGRSINIITKASGDGMMFRMGGANHNILFVAEDNSSTAQAYWGLAGVANGLVTGVGVNDLVWRSVNNNILFSSNNGTSPAIFIKGGTLATGFGNLTSPTALVHIAAGSATASTAPLKFTSGTLLTTPESGAVEYLSGTFYIRGTDGLSVAGSILIADGTSAAPSLAFSSNADGTGTGIYRFSTNRLGISCNGTHIGAFLSTGIELESMLGFSWNNQGSIAASASGQYRWSANGGVNLTKIIYGNNDGTGIQWNFDTTAVTWLTNSSGTSNTGKLGIGQTPTAKLHIGAGSATANTAPLKFTSGTLLGTIEVGAKEANAQGTYQTSITALNRYAEGGVIADFITTVDNGTTVETDLYTYTTKANTLAANGEKIEAWYAGTFNDLTATSQLRLYFGGTLIADTGLLTVSAIGGWSCNVLIIRTSSTTARTVVTINTPGASTALYTSQIDLTGLTLSGTNILKITGTAAGATGGTGDISGKLGTIYWYGSANN